MRRNRTSDHGRAPPSEPKPLSELDELRLEVLPVLRIAELALREPQNVELRTEACAQVAELLSTFRKRMNLTQHKP